MKLVWNPDDHTSFLGCVQKSPISKKNYSYQELFWLTNNCSPLPLFGSHLNEFSLVLECTWISGFTIQVQSAPGTWQCNCNMRVHYKSTLCTRMCGVYITVHDHGSALGSWACVWIVGRHSIMRVSSSILLTICQICRNYSSMSTNTRWIAKFIEQGFFSICTIHMKLLNQKWRIGMSESSEWV